MSDLNGTYGKREKSRDSSIGVRDVAPTYGKVRHRIHSRKAGGDISVESNAERLIAHMLTIDPRVRSFKPQPFTVDLIEGRIIHNQRELSELRKKHSGRSGPKFYTPDFEIEWTELVRSAVEVKLEGYEGNDDYSNRLNRAVEILQANGYRFTHIVFPSDSSHPLYTSMVLLKQAASRTTNFPNWETGERITQICGRRSIRMRDLCVRLNVSADMVPALLVLGYLSADIAKHPIDSELELMAARGDLSHLELLERFSK